MINLDDTQQLLSALGGDAVLTSVQRFPQQIVGSMTDTLALSFPEDYSSVQNIVLCGMGGSRFPGLIVYYLYKQDLRVPFEICDDYTLPGSVTHNTLVVLSSYSGTTEEVLHCAEEARKRNAKIVGFSVGGPLSVWLKENGYPYYVFNQDNNPSGQPRMGFGYTAGSLLGILIKLNLISHAGSQDDFIQNIVNEVRDASKESARFDVVVSRENNEAKKLAAILINKYPYLVVSEHLTGVGNCFQNQINETSKNISSFRVIPELNHHLMEGLQFPTEHKKMALFLTIFSDLYTERVCRRFEVTEDVVRQNNIEVSRVSLRTHTKLGQVVELSIMGSYVTMYMAGLYGVDPAKIPYVDYFKAELKK